MPATAGRVASLDLGLAVPILPASLTLLWPASLFPTTHDAVPRTEDRRVKEVLGETAARVTGESFLLQEQLSIYLTCLPDTAVAQPTTARPPLARRNTALAATHRLTPSNRR